MDEARIYIDFNERVDGNVFLLSKDDSKVDSKGNTVTFYEDMPLRIWSDDLDSSFPSSRSHPMTASIPVDRR